MKLTIEYQGQVIHWEYKGDPDTTINLAKLAIESLREKIKTIKA